MITEACFCAFCCGIGSVQAGQAMLDHSYFTSYAYTLRVLVASMHGAAPNSGVVHHWSCESNVAVTGRKKTLAYRDSNSYISKDCQYLWLYM